MTLPNALSLSRVALGIAVFLVVLTGERVNALLLFVVGVVTDVADGALARRTTSATSFGAFLDPLGDKVLVYGALAPLAGDVRIGTAFGVLLVRDAVVTWLRRRRSVHPSRLARLKTATLYAACAWLLVSSGGGDLPREPADLLLAAGTALAILTALQYGVWLRVRA